MISTNKMISVEEGVERIQRVAPRVGVAPPGGIKLVEAMKNELRITVEDQPYTIGWRGLTSFKNLTGADSAMLSRLPANFRAEAFKWLMGALGESVSFKFTDKEIVSFSKEDMIGCMDRVERAVDCLKPIGMSNISVQGDKLGVGFVLEEKTEPPTRQGDVVHSGIHLSVNGGLSITDYNLRLVCTNGMLGMSFEAKRDISKEDFADALRARLETTRGFAKSFVGLVAHPVGDSGAIISRLQASRVLNGEQIQKVVEGLASIPDGGTEYDLVNLVTSYQHKRPNDLGWLRSGGRMVEVFAHDHCSHCGA